MTIFRLFDAAGNVLLTEEKVFNHKRFSQRAAAQHKFLDAMYARYQARQKVIDNTAPNVARAELCEGNGTPLPFEFRNGRSVCTFKF